MSMQGGDEMELGKQIKMHRQEAHLSQEELANRVYVSRQTISNWENDKSYPDVNSLVLLSEIFQISLDNLIKGDIEVMKDVIQKEEIEKMNRYGKSYTIMLIATAVSAVPLFMWLGVWAFIPWGIIWAISMYFAFSPERLLFILKYGIAYVRFHKEINGKIEFIEQKHIMRYQQMFAALTVRSKIDEGVNSGVIWHTQGSGKTALSYYLTYVLSDYFSKQNKVAKFYFIVDRLDLLKQASEEFEARGLVVKTASSRAELMEQFRNNQAQEGNTGKPEITVVNIQRFAEDRSKVDLPAYATNLQRVFIIDGGYYF